MTADSGRVPFYVVFSDENKEMNVGTVMVESTMNFQSLLTLMSHKIGISPHQFNIFLATMGSDRRIPITAKFNLADVLRDGVKYYFVVKRSRNSPSNDKNTIPNNNNRQQNAMLHPRHSIINGMLVSRHGLFPLPGPSIMNGSEYQKGMRIFHTGRKSFLLNIGINRDPVRGKMPKGFGSGSGPICELCSRAYLKGIDASFHLCIHDEVTIDFRTMAGPISRPVRNSSKKAP